MLLNPEVQILAEPLRLACVWSEEPICGVWFASMLLNPEVQIRSLWDWHVCGRRNQYATGRRSAHLQSMPSIATITCGAITFLQSPLSCTRRPQYPSGSLPWRLKMTPWRTSVKSPSAIWVVPIFKTSQYKYPWSIFSQLSTVSTIGLSSMPYLWTKHGTGHNYLRKAMVIIGR